MILDKIIELGFAFFNTIVDALKLSSINLDVSVMDTFLDVINSVAYFLPVTYIAPIFGFIIVLQVYRIVIAIIRLIKSVVPFA